MTLVKWLVGIDASGAFLLGASGVAFAIGAIRAWRKNGHSVEIDLLLGLGLGFIGHAVSMILSMVRRQMSMRGEPIWWFVDSWPYFGTKMIAIAAGLLALRGWTKDNHGEWPWLAALALVAVFVAWNQPAAILGAWLYAAIERWH